MEYIIKEQKLELIYQPGKGAWTYHLRIPNTKNIEGQWGHIKVSGFIDSYKIEARNLAPIKGEDKMLSINATIRKAINKKGITESQILETFEESNVLKSYKKLSQLEKQEILDEIMLQKSDDKQIKLIVAYIDKLSKHII
jgi:Domain of unknown function (DUF1905)